MEFYEHLVDDEVTKEAIPYWIKPTIFKEIQSLFKDRLEQDEYKKLIDHYNIVNKTNFNIIS